MLSAATIMIRAAPSPWSVVYTACKLKDKARLMTKQIGADHCTCSIIALHLQMDKAQVDSVLHDEHNKSQSIRLTREGIHILVCQVFTGVAEFLARELLLKERHSERPMEGPLGCFKES